MCDIFFDLDRPAVTLTGEMLEQASTMLRAVQNDNESVFSYSPRLFTFNSADVTPVMTDNRHPHSGIGNSL